MNKKTWWEISEDVDEYIYNEYFMDANIDGQRKYWDYKTSEIKRLDNKTSGYDNYITEVNRVLA